MNYQTIIKKCFIAWQERDWNFINNLLANDFSFTSLYDDNINKAEFKQKCWDPVNEIEKFEIIKIMEDGNEVFVNYTGKINGNSVQNIEHFVFQDEKINKIEVYFGRSKDS